MSRPVSETVERLIDDAFSVLQHDADETQAPEKYEREALRRKFTARLNGATGHAQSSFERVSVEKLATHFQVSVAQAQSAQDDLGFMFRELAVGIAQTPAMPQDVLRKVQHLASICCDEDVLRWFDAHPAALSDTSTDRHAGLINPDVLMNVVQAKLNDYIELHNRGDLTEHGDHAWLALVNLQRDMEFALKRADVSDSSPLSRSE
jgi:hypothetical protein